MPLHLQSCQKSPVKGQIFLSLEKVQKSSLLSDLYVMLCCCVIFAQCRKEMLPPIAFSNKMNFLFSVFQNNFVFCWWNTVHAVLTSVKSITLQQYRLISLSCHDSYSCFRVCSLKNIRSLPEMADMII